MVRTLFIVFVCMVSFSLVGCSGTSTDNLSDRMQEDIVKVGIIAPLSGPTSTRGKDAMFVYQDILQSHNSNQIELISEDGKCESRASVSAVQKLITVDQVDIIIGGVCSSETIAAGKIANQYGVPMLSPISSAPEISNIGEYMFRFWNDVQAGITAGEYLSQEYESIALVYENTDYAQALADEVRKNYQGEIHEEIAYDTNEKDFNLLSQKLLGVAQLEGVMIINQSETTAAALIKSFERTGLRNQIGDNIMGVYVFSSQAFLDEVGDLANGLIEVQLAGVETLGSKSQNYLAGVSQEYQLQSIPLVPLLSAEAMSLIVDAVESGATDRESLREYFVSIDESNLREGYFGDYYFRENGDAVGLEFVIQRIQEGKGMVVK